ncbi:hypothetical protein BV22DRAFT_1196568 [Leucogyrophana mollusca]|uniref:Uncharacterized protein n=1 Tax=Leucogyrophana mollusca TaxID=85980 RepID=A0ACB8BFP7_9AGAM|nr:hypothetical protein BV22DRAFT_1196568 [Leucogyrophana mollusca]
MYACIASLASTRGLSTGYYTDYLSLDHPIATSPIESPHSATRNIEQSSLFVIGRDLPQESQPVPFLSRGRLPTWQGRYLIAVSKSTLGSWRGLSSIELCYPPQVPRLVGVPIFLVLNGEMAQLQLTADPESNPVPYDVSGLALSLPPKKHVGTLPPELLLIISRSYSNSVVYRRTSVTKSCLGQEKPSPSCTNPDGVTMTCYRQPSPSHLCVATGMTSCQRSLYFGRAS